MTSLFLALDGVGGWDSLSIFALIHENSPAKSLDSDCIKVSKVFDTKDKSTDQLLRTPLLCAGKNSTITAVPINSLLL